MLDIKVIKRDDVVSLMIPRYEELTVTKIWEMIQDSDEYTIYFPNLKSNELLKW